MAISNYMTDAQLQSLITSYLNRHPEGRTKEDLYILIAEAEVIIIAYVALALVLDGKMDVDLTFDADGNPELRYFPAKEDKEA